MKKLVFAIAAVVAISFASCGGNTQNTLAEDTLAADTLIEEVVEDTAACCGDSCCAAGDSVVAE